MTPHATSPSHLPTIGCRSGQMGMYAHSHLSHIKMSVQSFKGKCFVITTLQLPLTTSIVVILEQLRLQYHHWFLSITFDKPWCLVLQQFTKVFIPLIALRTYLESVVLAYCFYNNVNLSFVHFIDSASTSFSQSSQGGGHRTLLYGHAILLKHTHSSMVSTFTIKYAATAALCCPVLKAAVLPTVHYSLNCFEEHVISGH